MIVQYYIPYSGKFSRGPIFADWSLGKFFQFTFAQDLRHTHIDALKIHWFNFRGPHHEQQKLISSKISHYKVYCQEYIHTVL